MKNNSFEIAALIVSTYNDICTLNYMASTDNNIHLHLSDTSDYTPRSLKHISFNRKSLNLETYSSGKTETFEQNTFNTTNYTLFYRLSSDIQRYFRGMSIVSYKGKKLIRRLTITHGTKYIDLSKMR